jgi:hypothetical protein
MSIARVVRTLAVTAVAGVLAGTTYGAQAARAPVAPAHQAQVRLTGHHLSHPFRGTFPLGMHCDSMHMPS